MIRDINRFSNKEYDLLVIGGGINGAAVANIAAGAGMSVALVEKGDFASGTSSKSTKLVHGGIRYLENFEFDLVAEALHERFVQMQSVPYLVKPLPFVIPVYRGDRRPLWMMKLGVFLYDLLSGRYKIGRHQTLTKEQLLQMVPGIKQEHLSGGVLYYDAQMDDARLCLENILCADQKGAHVVNYTEVVSFIKESGRAAGIQARDVLSGNVFAIKAKKIVSTVGPWTNALLALDDTKSRPLVRATKGIHLVYRGPIADRALLLTAENERRIFFVIPWKGNSLIGTTDTDFKDSPDRVEADEADVEYLFKEARRFFPGLDFRREKIIATFAGLRPLIAQKGNPSQVSRKHVIHETRSGIIFVIGGKYTTYRKIAQDCLSYVLKGKARFSGDEYPLFGSGKIEEPVEMIAAQFRVSKEAVEYLRGIYGTKYRDVLFFIKVNPQCRKPLCSCSPAIEAQVFYAIKNEMAVTPDDVIWRRLSLGHNDCASHQCRQRIQQIFAEFR